MMHLRIAHMLTAFIALTMCASCAPVPPRVYRIALIAPFEGRHRQIGYDAFPALRLAVRDDIQSHPDASIQIEFVAYNDNGDPAAARRMAQNAALDPQVVAVIGHLRLETTLSAIDVYTRAGLSLLVPNIPAHLLPQDPLVFRVGPSERAIRAVACTECGIAAAPSPAGLPAAQQALAQFTALSLGPQPTARSITAYDAATVLLNAARDAASRGTLDRTSMALALRRVRTDGLTGSIYFDELGRWPDAPAYASEPEEEWQ
jgi:ABC-type branched-subunit amino acid transport system substrate-binding protein